MRSGFRFDSRFSIIGDISLVDTALSVRKAGVCNDMAYASIPIPIPVPVCRGSHVPAGNAGRSKARRSFGGSSEGWNVRHGTVQVSCSKMVAER